MRVRVCARVYVCARASRARLILQWVSGEFGYFTLVDVLGLDSIAAAASPTVFSGLVFVLCPLFPCQEGSSWHFPRS